nr:DUF3272 family protein [Streptococcus suis]
MNFWYNLFYETSTISFFSHYNYFSCLFYECIDFDRRFLDCRYLRLAFIAYRNLHFAYKVTKFIRLVEKQTKK